MKKNTKSAAAKAAMANRGKFESKHTDYPNPIHYKVAAAVTPFSVAAARAAAVWADTLVDCVPPSYALRFRELKSELDVAMMADDFTLCADLATSLIKALKMMNQKARDDGFKPPQIDGHIVEWKDKIYCFLADGDVSAIRKARPSWTVYQLSDVCAVLSAQTDEMMAAVTNEFPAAKIVNVKIYDDEILFGNE